MKLPTRSLPPNFGADIQSAGLGGLPFSWGSDADLNLDDPRLTPEQKNAILGVALKDTPLASAPGAPLAITNQDLLRFIGQRDAAGLPGIGAIGGGGDTGPGGPPGAPDGSFTSNDSASMTSGAGRTGIQQTLDSIVDGLNSPTGRNITTGLGLLGAVPGVGAIPGAVGLGAKALGWVGNMFGLGNHPDPTMNLTPEAQQALSAQRAGERLNYNEPDPTTNAPQTQTTVEDAVSGMSGIGPTGQNTDTTGVTGVTGVEGMTNDADASGTGGSGGGAGAGSGGGGPSGDGGPSSGDYARGGSVRKPMSRAQRVRAFEAKHGTMEI